ncbi:hypothetical protein [Amycolatopsis sp. NPDC054798]
MPDPSVRLLLVFPDRALADKAVRAGLVVGALVEPGRSGAELSLAPDQVLRLEEGERADVAEAVSRLVKEHGFTQVLDAAGLPVPARRFSGAPARQAGRPLRVAPDTFGRASSCDPGRRTVETVAQVPAAVAELGGAVVLRRGPGEQVVETADALEQWVRAQETATLPSPVTVELIEETELVATTLTVNGMHRVVGIVEAHAAGARRRLVYPARLAESEAVRVRAAVTGMLDLADHEFGPVQTRVVLAGGAPYVAGALPGFSVHRVSELLQTATGADLPTELFRGLAGAPIEPPRPRWFAAAECEAGNAWFAGREAEQACPPRPPAEGISAEAALARLDELRVE